MKIIQNSLKKLPEYNELLQAVKSNNTPAIVTGVSGIHKAVLTGALQKDTSKKILLIASDEPEAQRFYDDLTVMGLKCCVYPLRDFCLRETSNASHEYEHQRLEALMQVKNNSCDCVIACIDAALQYTISSKDLEERLITLHSGDTIKPEDVIETLINCGYTREDQIDGHGQFSHRGGIIDFCSPGLEQPIRIEYWGDEIDSIAYFEIETQRRTEHCHSITISPCVEVIPNNKAALIKKIEKLSASLRGKIASKARETLQSDIEKLRNDVHLASIDKYISLIYDNPATLFDYFTEDSIVLFSEGNKLKERMRTTLWQWGEDLKDYLQSGTLCKGLDQYSESWEYTLQAAEKTASVFLDIFARGTYEIPTKSLFNLTVRQLSIWGGSIDVLKEDLEALLHQRRACVVLAGTVRTATAVAEDLKNAGIPADYIESPSTAPKGTVVVTTGTLTAGYELPGADFCLITNGKTQTSAKKRRKTKKDKNTKEISSLSELAIGDLVVHSTHGIGVFEGIHKIDMNGIVKDYIKVKYAKSDTLYVPVTQLDLVSKYIGPRDDFKIKLSNLGGNDWQRAKAKVRTAVKDIAKDLIELYSKRMHQKGFAFPGDTEWQHDFEARFEYEETEDQLNSINEIKDDMEREVPMDRLLCGDVGFGKTEVALRAAFKCITAGKQVAFLVPTTILAWQHYQTIIKRFEGFPIDVEIMSRYRTPKQQNEILKRMKNGSLDMVVGTHRLVSKDIKFKDLGLVIIDEEQRFGVAQKEKLKAVCQTADVLTLSATPIPRTLSMSLSGIRDMSVIEEAPHDRHPVQTYVMEYDAGVITDAIKKEIRRGGQVYYLHNDVASISRTAAHIKALVPEARVGIGHGKMAEEELSDVWRSLLDHEIDVLVCTTIIETGVDVPNANTLIIENADRMGLSQLHQIRGRVGRSTRRAYAYLTYTQNKVLSDLSQKRLTAIKEFTEFGSGFKIAMRDLEIRGAGNILGGEQHGHMETVGYEMYVKLLNQAISEAKGETPIDPEVECVVDMQVQAHIPESYIDSTNIRLDIYRKIADIRSSDDALDVTDELIDRFGDPPGAVKGLIDVALLRNTASSLGIEEIKQTGANLLLYKKKFDMKAVSELVKTFKGRVLLSAGSRPYISIKINSDSSTKLLSEVLKVMTESADKSADESAYES